MKIKISIQRSIRSLMLHRMRSLLSTLGILFGVTAVVAMLSIGEGAKRETLEQIEQLGMNTMIIRQNSMSEEQQSNARKNLSQGLTLEDSFLIEKGIPGIISQAPIKVINASLPGSLQNMTPEIIAATRAYGEIKGLKLAKGRYICDLDQKEKKLVCVLGSDVAKALGSYGNIGQNLRIESQIFQIVGILESNYWKATKNVFVSTKNINQIIFIPLGSERGILTNLRQENNMLSEIILQINPKYNLNKVSEVVKNILKHVHGNYEDYQIIVPLELLNQANQTQRTFNLVLGSIATISLLVGGIGIMNMMLANVTERIKEIGIRRALGATKIDILLQFLTETLLLTLFGACLGVIVGCFFSFTIGYLAGWKTIVTVWSILLSLGMAAGVGICSGIYPANQAANLHPIVALRHE